MHRSLIFSALVALIFCSAAGTARSHPALSGAMAPLQSLIGTWDCTVSAMTAPGTMMQTASSITFSEAPGNVISQAVTSPTYTAYGFIGYNSTSSKFFTTNVDNMGGVASETSSMSSPSRVVFTGTGTMYGRTLQVRDTEEMINDTKIHSLSEAMMSGKWTTVADSTCTKR